MECRKTYYDNGNIKEEFYFENGNYHNLNSPSGIFCYENGQIRCEEYYIEGKRHRKDGPAIIEYDENRNIERKEYYINNIQYDEFEYFVMAALKNNQAH